MGEKITLTKFQRKEIKKQCEKLWAKNKYFVLSKSQRIYNDIRQYLKNDIVDIEKVKFYINGAMQLKEDKGCFINACQHIWGYFSKQSTKDEKNKFIGLLELYQENQIEKDEIIQYLKELLYKYPNSYLKNSSFFNGDNL